MAPLISCHHRIPNQPNHQHFLRMWVQNHFRQELEKKRTLDTSPVVLSAPRFPLRGLEYGGGAGGGVFLESWERMAREPGPGDLEGPEGSREADEVRAHGRELYAEAPTQEGQCGRSATSANFYRGCCRFPSDGGEGRLIMVDYYIGSHDWHALEVEKSLDDLQSAEGSKEADGIRAHEGGRRNTRTGTAQQGRSGKSAPTDLAQLNKDARGNLRTTHSICEGPALRTLPG